MCNFLNISNDYFVYSYNDYDIYNAEFLHCAYYDTIFYVILIKSNVYCCNYYKILVIFLAN